MQAEDLVINTYVIQSTCLFVSSVFHIDSSIFFSGSESHVFSPKSLLRNESRESEGLSLWNAEMYSVDFNMKEANTPGCKGFFLHQAAPNPTNHPSCNTCIMREFASTIGGPSKIPYDMEEIWQRTNYSIGSWRIILFVYFRWSFTTDELQM